jgi:hypothetical protein
MAQPANAVPANPAAPAIVQDDDMKQICADFRILRAEGRWPNAMDNININRLKFPRRGVFRGVKKVRHRFTGIPFTEGINSLGVGHRRNMDAAKAARDRVVLRVAPAHLTPLTTLGWGGNGIATLYRYSHNNIVDYMVVKAAIRNRQACHDAIREEAKKQKVRCVQHLGSHSHNHL